MTDMFQLAREAVDNKNFDLATEIYDRLLKDSEPTMEVLVSKGDCLAKAGRLSEAFDAYAHASRLGEVQPEKLTCLVDFLVGNLCTKEGIAVQDYVNEPLDMFSCLFCHSILFEPTTLSCGHTFCKSCFFKHKATCKQCGQYHGHGDKFPVKVDVLLSGQLEKYFSSAYKAAKLKNEGNLKYNEGDFNGAMKLYSEASALAPLDHLIASNKSHVLSAQKQLSEAIKEADRACKLQPRWPKGYFRKGCALMMAGKYEEALISLLQCLSLDPSITKAKTTLAKVLQEILSPLPTSENLKYADLQHHGILSGRVHGMSTPISIFSTELDDLASAISMGFNQSKRNNANSQSSSTDVSSEASDSEEVACKTGSKSDGTSCKDKDITKDVTDTSAACAQRKRKRSDPSVNSRSPPASAAEFSCTELKPHQPRVIPPELLNRSDYECSLCFRLLHEPVTTPCGHTFCTGCLNRCLDHNPQCPLCKDSLSEYLAKNKWSVNVLIQNIMRQYFEKDFQERDEIHAQELEELRGAARGQKESIIPIFICTTSFPTIPCPLHIFEPRYRLMIRQCMESGSKQFGMCVPSEQNDFSDYGCMLEIQGVQALPDGRSIIRTIGGRRFKVLSRGMREGYNTAKVGFIEDETIEEEDEIAQVKALHQSVYAEASSWFNGLRSVVRSRVSKHYGAMPALPANPLESSDGPGWTWWLLAILPIAQRAQLECMSIANLRERLLFLRRCLRATQSRRSGDFSVLII